MKTLLSTDGTPIAYSQRGKGDAVVLIHGMLSDITVWAGLQPLLNERFTTYAINRRGRTGSGEIGSSGWEQQFADVVSLINKLDPPVHVFGHSLGALVALGALPRVKNVASVSLYDPAPTLPMLADAAKHVAALVEEGHAEDAVTGFLKSVGTSREILDALKTTPFWPLMINLAPTIAPELNLLATGDLDDNLLKSIQVPVLLLRGSKSPAPIRAVCDTLHTQLPEGRVVEIPNQGHLGPTLAPQEVFDEVNAFIASLG